MRVAIAGAGNVGRSIARELLENGHEVLLIEREPKALKQATVPEASWLLADACELDSLVEARLQECNVVVAAAARGTGRGGRHRRRPGQVDVVPPRRGEPRRGHLARRRAPRRSSGRR